MCRYSRVGGFCNNLKHPNAGTPNIPYGRMLKAAYSDGKELNRMRKNVLIKSKFHQNHHSMLIKL